MTEPVNLELLRAVLTQIDETGSYPVGGSDADELVQAARAYAAIGTKVDAVIAPPRQQQASPQLLADLAHMCHIMKTNQAHHAGTQTGEAFQKMHDVTAEALALLTPPAA